MRLHPALQDTDRQVASFRNAPLSTQLVEQVRDALFAKELRPGDFLGTEKELAERFGVSRVVARDALRTLEAQGVVDIKVGANGGARISLGNTRLFADALAVQLELADVSIAEIIDAQSATECLAAELAALNSTPEDVSRLCKILADSERNGDDPVAGTRLGREFHLAIAESSHNRVLVVQLISLQHVSWPTRNPTLTPEVAADIVRTHRELLSFIEARDGAGARRLMEQHVRMIGVRRMAERMDGSAAYRTCC